MVELNEEWNAVRVAARYRGQYAIGRSHAVTAGFDGEFHDILRIEVERVGGERRARRVLYALVDRQNGQVPRSRQTPGVVEGLHITQHRRRAVVIHHHPVDVIRSR